MQRCSVAVVLRYRGAEVQRCKLGAYKVLKCRGAEVQWSRGGVEDDVQRRFGAGAEMQRCRGLEEQRWC